MPRWLVNWLIRQAQKTPYTHIPGYMNRWWLIKPRSWLPFAARIHQILRSDKDRHLHDHPWDYCTIILRGGYFEVTRDKTSVSGRRHRWYGPGRVLFRRATDAHQLTLPDGPTWTLFITGPYKQGWGFLTSNGKIPWRQYLGTNPEAEAEMRKHFPSR